MVTAEEKAINDLYVFDSVRQNSVCRIQKLSIHKNINFFLHLLIIGIYTI